MICLSGLTKQKLHPFHKLIHLCYSSKTTSADHRITVSGDIIGPPNPISNIRPIIFHAPQNESTIEKIFRLKRENVQKWHEEFWIDHNTKFIQEKKEFEMKIKETKPKGSNIPLTADEMSIFYKSFLDKYWKVHIWYNLQWYKKNMTLLSLALRVEINRLKNKILNK